MERLWRTCTGGSLVKPIDQDSDRVTGGKGEWQPRWPDPVAQIVNGKARMLGRLTA